MFLDTMVLSSPNSAMLPVESDLPTDMSDMQFDMHSSMGENSIISSTSQDGRKRKGLGMVGKSVDEEVCHICGDRASGYHYNALSCEGCKGFFRRSITRAASYHCKYGGRCEMDMWMRRKCQFCRLRRCREVGMKEECLLSEEQCKARDIRRKQKTKKPRKEDALSPESMTGSIDKSDIEDSKLKLKVEMKPDTIIEHSPLLKVSNHTKTLVERLVLLQDKYEFPDEQVAKTVEASLSDVPKSDTIVGDVLLSQLAKMTVIITPLIVDFAKNLPGFLCLSKKDQIVLLKAVCSEVMAIRAARCYDLTTKSIILANGTPCTRENMIAAGGSSDYWELMFNFCHAMAENQTDNTEYALFTAICIFSGDREGLHDKEQVEQIQQIYTSALTEYLDKKRHHSGTCLAKLLVRLNDLRSISLEHSEMLMSMQMDDDLMPHIVQDIYIQK